MWNGPYTRVSKHEGGGEAGRGGRGGEGEGGYFRRQCCALCRDATQAGTINSGNEESVGSTEVQTFHLRYWPWLRDDVILYT